MIHVYCPFRSTGARDLVRALGGRRIRNRRPRTTPTHVVCWGSPTNDTGNGIKMLNNGPYVSKYQAAVKLKEAKVPTVEVSKTRQAGWLGRENGHVGGNDLLNPTRNPDYWSKKEQLVEEYRIHSFLGHSIRAGRKVPIEGKRPHQWIRSEDAGWRLCYSGFQSTKEMRKIARRAVKALGLDFGAVDIAKTADGRLIVLEVNRSPGLGDNTCQIYAAAIQKWVEGKDEGEE